ncbi:MAG: transcriptional regulator [Thermoplasmata archaeon]|nr:MAG: transcriptional regulator [Thermoplasmata archaeon]RLF35820.1 MAG: transcriptional regulator [Thermoplasmata archaeon]
MERAELLQCIRDTLMYAGFYVSELYIMRLMGFDLVARKDNALLIVKVLTNIDSLSEDVANELKTLSFLLHGSPMLIGERDGSGPLEDNVVYYRFGIQAITFNTLKNHLLDGMSIKAYAAPGGTYVNLDEKKLRRLRQEQNISLGEFARFVRVSRRTARLYEEGMNARFEIALRIEKLLGSTITIPIDILGTKSTDRKDVVLPGREINSLKTFQREIFSLLEKVGYKIIPMERCPFEALSKDRDQILLTCAHRYSRKLFRKAQIVSSISRITEKHAVLFIDREIGKTNIEGTPIIMKSELKKIRDPEEVIDLIIERKIKRT